MIKEINIRVSPEINADHQLLKSQISKQESISAASFDFTVLKRSIDARSRTPVIQLKILLASGGDELPSKTIKNITPQSVSFKKRAIVIGAGPAGLFAALQLIENDIQPIVLERGKNVRDRRRDLATLNKEHIVNPESNYCFGEGGAGTYSDGKLYTRSDKRGDVNAVLETLIAFGADPNILVESHPHIGTNKLPKIIENIRNYLLACGAEIHFNSKVTDFIISKYKIKTVVVNDIQEIEAENIILATGHSSRDIFALLKRKGIYIENKPFALGVRVEHPQEIINKAQYNQSWNSPLLPPASYSLVTQTPEKAVYSFCMCPGGIIAPCATAPGEVVTNGWSPSKRNNPFANSGIVIPVDEQDWNAFEHHGALAAMEFQKSIEHTAFIEGGKSQTAPAQRLVDFLNNKTSSSLPKSSYQPGIKSVDLKTVLPQKFSTALQLGLKDFCQKMKPFYSEEAVLHAVESRTSSPVKIPREKENLHHIEIHNLYPCGEGAGYAGGIMSAAIDGIKCANAIALKVN